VGDKLVDELEPLEGLDLKKIFATLMLVGLSMAAFAQSQVDVSILAVGADVTKQYPGTAAKSGLLDSQKNSSVGATVTYTYTAKLDDANTVKGGVVLDYSMPLVSGTDLAYQSQSAYKAEPFVQYQGFGIDAKATLAVVSFGPIDDVNYKSGYNAAGAYNIVKYGPLANSSSTTSKLYPITQTYLEPKLTYDFGNVGVKGFKAYVAGRAALATTDAAYGAAGSTTAWHDSRVQPGVSYSTALEGIGTLGCDLSVRFNKIDYDANNTKDNPTPSVANSAKPGSNDVRLNLTYSQKF